jgi:HTH-type transcriptional regulator/antitoxin HigA
MSIPGIADLKSYLNMLKQKSQAKGETERRGKAGQPARHVNSKKIKIKTGEVYEVVMKEIEVLMKKGEAALSASELTRLRVLAEAAEVYEDATNPLPLPSSLQDIIKMKMFQLQLNQQFAAQLLGVSEAKFSLIMNGKQKPDVYFLKAVHEKLKVDANLLLETV